MADAQYQTEMDKLRMTDVILGGDQTQTEGSMAARASTGTELLKLFLVNFPTDLTNNEKSAIRSALSIAAGGLNQSQVDARVRAVAPDVLTGTGEPDNANGKEGDLYARTGSTEGIYYKTSTQWEQVANVSTGGTTLSLMSQTDAEGGTATDARSISALRIKQAIDALGFKITYVTAQPTANQGADGDFRFNDGANNTGPGLYYKSGGSWSNILPRNYVLTAAEATTATSTRDGLISGRRLSQAVTAFGVEVHISGNAPGNSDGKDDDLWVRTGNTSPGLSVKNNGSWVTVASSGSGGGITVSSGTAAPTGGSHGDLYVRTGSTEPGIYINLSGAWARYADLGAGGGGSGDITAVSAGNGLTGGGTTGAVSLAVGAGEGIEVSADAVTVKLDGTTLTKSAAGLSVTNPGSGGGDGNEAREQVGVSESTSFAVNITNRDLRGRTPGQQNYAVNEDLTPRGGATDGTRTWIADGNIGTNGRRVRGYRTRADQNTVSFHNDDWDIPSSIIASNATLEGVAYSESNLTLYVADSTNIEIRAYDVRGLEADPPTAIIRDTAKDFDTATLQAANADIVLSGLVTDGVHLWVCDSNGRAAWAWRISDKARNTDADFTTSNLDAASSSFSPSGGFINGAYHYFTDLHTNAIYALDSVTHDHNPLFDVNHATFDGAKPSDTRIGAARPYGGFSVGNQIGILDGGAGPYAGLYGFYVAHEIVVHIIEELQQRLKPSGMRLNSNATAGFGWNMGYNTAELTLDPMTNDEITAGTSTDEHTISPAGLKLAAETHGSGADVSDKLEKDDIVAGTNVTLGPVTGNARGITINAAGGSGGPTQPRALMPETVAERGLDTTPYAISGLRLDEAIQARAPGTYIAAAERWPERDANWVGGHSSHPIVTGAISYGSNLWLCGSNDTLTSFVGSSGARDSSRDFSAAQLRAAGANIDPSGGWGYNGILYVLSQSEDKVYAFSASSKAHDRDKDFETAEVIDTDVAAAISLTSGFSNGDLTWLVDAVSRQCFAWRADKVDRNATRTREPDHDITTAILDAIAQAFAPRATFTSPDGKYVWIINSSTNIAHCIQLANRRRAEERDIPASIITAGRSPVLMRGGCSLGNYGYAVQQVSTNNLRGANVNAFKLPAAQADHYPVVSEAEALAGTGTTPRIYTPQRVTQQFTKPVQDAITIASDLQKVWDGRLGDPAVATIYGPSTLDIPTPEDNNSGTAIPTWSSSVSNSIGRLCVHQGRIFISRSSSVQNTAPPTTADTNPNLNTKWELAAGWRTDVNAVVLGDDNLNGKFSFDFDPPAGQPALAESLSFSIGFKFSNPFQNGIWIFMAANNLGLSDSNNAQDRGFQFYVNLKSLASRGVFIEPKVPPTGSSNGAVVRPTSGEWTYFNGATDRDGQTANKFLKLPVWATGNGTGASDPLRTLTLVHHFGQLSVFADGILYGIFNIASTEYPFRRHTSGNNAGDSILGVGTKYGLQSLMASGGTRQFQLHGVSVGRPRLAEQANPKLEPFDLRRVGIPTTAGSYDVRLQLANNDGAGEFKFVDPPVALSHGSGAPSGGKDGDYKFRTGTTNPGIYARSGGSWSRFHNFNPPLNVFGSAPLDSSGSDGDIRIVNNTSDATENGVYVRASGAWVKVA